jgi:hypothetical protein
VWDYYGGKEKRNGMIRNEFDTDVRIVVEKDKIGNRKKFMQFKD